MVMPEHEMQMLVFSDEAGDICINPFAISAVQFLRTRHVPPQLTADVHMTGVTIKLLHDSAQELRDWMIQHGVTGLIRE